MTGAPIRRLIRLEVFEENCFALLLAEQLQSTIIERRATTRPQNRLLIPLSVIHAIGDDPLLLEQTGQGLLIAVISLAARRIGTLVFVAVSCAYCVT